MTSWPFKSTTINQNIQKTKTHKLISGESRPSLLPQDNSVVFRVLVRAFIGCLHLTWKKTELHNVITWQFWPICSFHFMLCCFDTESKLWIHVSSWITSCEKKILLCHVGIVREVPQKLVLSPGVSILDTIWQTLCSCTEMYKIFIAQKSYCAYCVLSLATIRSTYYFNVILNRTRSGRELFDHSSHI